MIEEGIVICSNDKKMEILKNQTELKNYTFFSIEQLCQKLYGFCDNKAMLFMKEKYQLSFDLIDEYIKYIPFVNDNTYNNLKLDSLLSAKKALINNNYFIYDKNFLNLLKQYPVTFVDVKNNIFTNRLREIVKKYTIVYDYNTAYSINKPIVYEFNDITDELLFVFNNIVDLVKKGVSLNKIFISNINSDYYYLLRRISYSYHLPIDLSFNENILNTKIVNDFFNLLTTSKSFDEVLQNLDNESFIYDKIFNLIVDYELEDKNPSELMEFFKYKFKGIKFNIDKYEQMIQTNKACNFSDDEYVFYLGFNLGASPKIYKDDGFLNDKELNTLGLVDSITKNSEAKEELKNLLWHTKNIIVTYKKNIASQECYPSNLIKELKLDVKTIPIEYGYNSQEDNIRLSLNYTKLLKYKMFDQSLEEYDISHLKYNSYDNKYKHISNQLLEDRFKVKKLKMSYSSIKSYFQCPFLYFADRILGLNEFKPSMAARLGTFSHAVLEDSYNADFSFSESVDRNTKLNALDAKDRFYFKMMEEVLSSLIEFNHLHEQDSQLKQIKRELHIELVEDNYVFEGFIDKLLYTCIDDNVYAAIVDYKTGKDVISLDNVYDGFHLQLPIYMYLLSKYEEFKNKKIHIIGIYLQKVNIIALDNTVDIISQRQKSFKLQGYTINDISLIPMFDKTYDKSSYIQSLATLKNGGFSRYAKVLSSDEENELIHIVDELINKAYNGITNGNYEIAPKRINGVNESCTYCKYKDICYLKYEDIVELEYKPYPKKDGDD